MTLGRCGTACLGALVGLFALWLVGAAGADPSLDRAQVDPLEAARARVAAEPNHVEALNDLGEIYYQLDRLEEALAVFTRAADLDTTQIAARVNQGIVLLDLGRPQVAATALEQALRLDPDDVSALINRGLADYAMDRTEQAVAGWTRALELDADNVLAHYHLGVAFADAQLFEEAVREWEQVVALEPEGEAGEQARANIERVAAILSFERERMREGARSNTR